MRPRTRHHSLSLLGQRPRNVAEEVAVSRADVDVAGNSVEANKGAKTNAWVTVVSQAGTEGPVRHARIRGVTVAMTKRLDHGPMSGHRDRSHEFSGQ